MIVANYDYMPFGLCLLVVHVKFVEFGRMVQQWKWAEADTKTGELISRDMTKFSPPPPTQKKKKRND